MFMTPAFLLRKKIIVEKLTQTGSISESSAKSLEEAGVINPSAFPKLTQNMVEQGILGITYNKKYYMK